MADVKYGTNGYVRCAKCGADAPATHEDYPDLCLDCATAQREENEAAAATQERETSKD
jgi:hypothetical protein